MTVRDFVSLQRAHQEFLATLRAKFYVDNLEIAQVPLVGSFLACVFWRADGKSAKPGLTVHKNNRRNVRLLGIEDSTPVLWRSTTLT